MALQDGLNGGSGCGLLRGLKTGRQCDAGGLEGCGSRDAGFGADLPALAVLADFAVLQPVEIAQEIGPFDALAGLVESFVKRLVQDQREKRAEHMAADGGVGGMVDWPGAHRRLRDTEQPFDILQVPVAEHRLQR